MRYFVLFAPPSSVECCRPVRPSRATGGPAGERDLLGGGSTALCRVDSSTMAGPQLCYYDNQKLDKQHGKIDLRRCDALLTGKECSSAATDASRFMFALRMRGSGSRTTGSEAGRGWSDAASASMRTYYISADSEATMNEWTDCLRGVLRKYGICDGETDYIHHVTLI